MREREKLLVTIIFFFSHIVFLPIKELTHHFNNFKGGYLDFSHLTELKKYIYITEIYRRKQYKSSKIKNKKNF